MSLAIGSACACMGGAVWAQQESTGATDASAIATKDQVAEVKVTATRHSTSLLKTPVAVTAVTQEALSRDGITDVRGLVRRRSTTSPPTPRHRNTSPPSMSCNCAASTTACATWLACSGCTRRI